MKPSLRRAYGCPCSGDAKAPGYAPGPAAPIAERVLKIVELDTGTAPDGCPWHAFHDPIVGPVLNLYRACSGDMGTTPALAMHMHPSNVEMEGLLHYCAAVNKIRATDRKRAEQKRKANANK